MEYQKIECEIDGRTVECFQNEAGTWISQKGLVSLYGKDKGNMSKTLRLIKGASIKNDSVVVNCTTTDVIGQDGKRYSITIYDEAFLLELDRKYRSNLGKRLIDSLNESFNDQKDNAFEIVTYHRDNLSLDIRFSPKEKDLWVTQNQMAILFGTTRGNIAHHIANILEDGELDGVSVCENFSHTAQDGKSYSVSFYNLEMIISVGFRVNSRNAVLFRRWANGILNRYMKEGYAARSLPVAETFETNLIKLNNRVDELFEWKEEVSERLLEPPVERIFFSGAFYDARELIVSLIRKAKKRIVLIDPYLDERALSYCSAKEEAVILDVCFSKKAQITAASIEAFQKQYGPIKTHVINDDHDRFLVIDDEEGYLIGTSLNSAGKSAFSIIQLRNPKNITKLLESFLK